MSKVFYVHWNESEAAQHARDLESLGYSVYLHSATNDPPKLGDTLPDAVVISLDRLPSHGCAVAEWFREARTRRGIPVIFVGGKPEKAQAARARFPDCHWCERGELSDRLKELLPAFDVAAA